MIININSLYTFILTLQCLSPSNLLKAFNLNVDRNISVSNFLDLCPAIIYELDEKHCAKNPSATAHIHPNGDDNDAEKVLPGGASPSTENGNLYFSLSSTPCSFFLICIEI